MRYTSCSFNRIPIPCCSSFSTSLPYQALFTPTTPLGSIYTLDGTRRSYRVARMGLKNLDPAELDSNLLNLQRCHGLQDTTIQMLKQEMVSLHQVVPAWADFDTWTRIRGVMAQI